MDPYYFTYEAERLGYHSQIILNGRIVNDGMGKYIADEAVKQMIVSGQTPKESKIYIFGLAFKENCPDIRNSKVNDILARFQEYGICPTIVDPWISKEDAHNEYGIDISDFESVCDADCIIVAVAHDCFRSLSPAEINKLFNNASDCKKVLIDVKGLFQYSDFDESRICLWRL